MLVILQDLLRDLRGNVFHEYHNFLKHLGIHSTFVSILVSPCTSMYSSILHFPFSPTSQSLTLRYSYLYPPLLLFVLLILSLSHQSVISLVWAMFSHCFSIFFLILFIPHNTPPPSTHPLHSYSSSSSSPTFLLSFFLRPTLPDLYHCGGHRFFLGLVVRVPALEWSNELSSSTLHLPDSMRVVWQHKGSGCRWNDIIWWK